RPAIHSPADSRSLAARGAVRSDHADYPGAAQCRRVAVCAARGGKARAVRSRVARRERFTGGAAAGRRAATGHMLQLIPPPLHRLLYRLADRLRRQWWKVRRPTRNSVLVVAFDATGRVLLVRHSYGPPVWALPGGGIDRGENPGT